ncbi:MAG: TVP38/TMEM64 family protein [Eubacterium sp.]|nr:TVP38/TMEM64 family protein [Eubacterium sp.]MBR1531666.1 TVP38/TMEM64 family protein [Eubacterium sp.]
MQRTKRHRTNFISAIIALVTMALLVALVIMLINHTTLEMRFNTIINWLEKIDRAVTNLDTEREILICIFALYIAKCQLPLPMSFLCAISGAVFPLDRALLINVVCTLFFFLVKYFEGEFIGGGWAGMILNIKKMHFIRDWIQFKGNGNPYFLSVTRLIPAIPLGMVSKYYGSMHYDLIYYMLLSLLGYAPRLYIYTKLGAAFTNPFSVQFITLLIILVAFTGISSLIFNIFYGVKSNQMTQTLLIYSQKEKYKIVL